MCHVHVFAMEEDDAELSMHKASKGTKSSCNRYFLDDFLWSADFITGLLNNVGTYNIIDPSKLIKVGLVYVM